MPEPTTHFLTVATLGARAALLAWRPRRLSKGRIVSLNVKDYQAHVEKDYQASVLYLVP